MLYYEEKTNKHGDKQANFYLTQGDTADFLVVPKTADGTQIDFSLISKVLLKLSDENYKQVFSKEFTANDANTAYQVRLESEETAGLDIGDYIYEVEYTFTDGTVNTPNQAVLEIMEQIIA